MDKKRSATNNDDDVVVVLKTSSTTEKKIKINNAATTTCCIRGSYENELKIACEQRVKARMNLCDENTSGMYYQPCGKQVLMVAEHGYYACEVYVAAGTNTEPCERCDDEEKNLVPMNVFLRP